MTAPSHGGKRPGAGRPRKSKGALVTLSVKLDQSQKTWVKEHGGAAYLRGLIERDMNPQSRIL